MNINMNIKISFFLSLFLIFVLVLFSFSHSVKAQSEEDTLECEGLSFEWNEKEWPKLILREKILKVLGPDFEKRWQLQESIRNPPLHEVIITLRKIKNLNPKMISVREVLKLRDQFDSNIFHNKEVLCQYKNSMADTVKPQLVDSFCYTLSPEEWELSPENKTCDPQWALKNIGVLQRDASSEWSRQWLYDLIETKKNKLLEQAKDYEDMGHIQEAQALLKRASQMRADGENILIGHPDTGYSNNPEIGSDRLVSPLDFTGNDTAYDYVGPLGFFQGHGTSMEANMTSPPLRQIVGDKNSGPLNQYIEGVAPKAKIQPLRVAEGQVIHLSFANLINALTAILKQNMALGDDDPNKVRILSMSLGGPLPNTQLQRLFQLANAQGIVSVAAAGNYIPSLVGKYVVWPAHYREVIAAGGSNIENNVWIGSSKGLAIDIMAPAENVWGTKLIIKNKVDSYGMSRSNGTSFATALSASSIALWMAFHGEEALAPYKENLHFLLQYLWDKITEDGLNTQLLCDKNTSVCSDIKDGQYAGERGILNVKALLEEELPSVEDFKIYLAQQNQKMQLINRTPTNPQIDDIKNIIQLNLETNEDVALGLAEAFNLGVSEPKDPKLESFIQNYGHELLVHLVNTPNMSRSLKNYLEERKLDRKLKSRSPSQIKNPFELIKNKASDGLRKFLMTDHHYLH